MKTALNGMEINKTKKTSIIPAVFICLCAAAAIAISLTNSERFASEKALPISVSRTPGTDAVGHKLAGNCYKEAPAEYIPDIRIYRTWILDYGSFTEYKHQIVINRKYRDSASVYYIDDTKNSEMDYFAYSYCKDTAGFEKKYKLSESKSPAEGFVLERYHIAEAARTFENETYPLLGTYYRDAIEVLKDGGMLIWVSAKRRLLEVTKDKGRYTVLTNAGVEYISFDQGKRVSDYYEKHFTMDAISESNKKSVLPMLRKRIVSGKILSNNVARIEYDDGCVTHWKIRLAKEDCDNNLNSDKNGNELDSQRAEGSIIWHNGFYKTDPWCIAWDIDTDTSREPEYR